MSIFQFEKILGVVLVVIVVVMASLGGYLWYVESRGIPTQHIASEKTQASILEGTYVCLQRTDGKRTTECTPGIKVKEDQYALDLAYVVGGEKSISLSNGMKILVGGVIVPVEEVSTDQWDRYSIKGIMRVEEVAKP